MYQVQLIKTCDEAMKVYQVPFSPSPQLEAPRTPQCPTKHLLLDQVEASSPGGAATITTPAEVMYEMVLDASQYRIACKPG